jgi:23S rRNA (pseudouridine1915-N3)-methyltransferase
LKVHLLYIGKPRSREANVLAQEYAQRVGRFCRFEMRQIRDEAAAAAYNRALRVVLDPSGEQITSQALAALLEKAGRDVVFFVGGADGFSETFRAGADRLLSLSKMTLPHELARVVLAEQLYRAFTILSNHPYPR